MLGTYISTFLDQLIYSREELPVQEMLQSVSIGVEFRASTGAQDKGGKQAIDLPLSSIGAIVKETPTGVDIVSLAEQSAAQLAGVSAGDSLIAINGLRVSMKSYQQWLKTTAPGTKQQISLFRRDELMQFELVLHKPEQDTAVLKMLDENNSGLDAWLRAPGYSTVG